jgi:hypothetical protein
VTIGQGSLRIQTAPRDGRERTLCVDSTLPTTLAGRIAAWFWHCGRASPQLQRHLAPHGPDCLFPRGGESPQCRMEPPSDRGRIVRRTCAAAQDVSLAAWDEIRSHSAHIALLHASIVNTRGIGARLAPIFGSPHRSILQ